MPAEVIDLLSSPDLHSPSRIKADTKTQSAVIGASRILAYELPKQKQEQWFTLSDSEEGVTLPSPKLPVTKPAVKLSGVEVSKKETKFDKGFYFLSDDFDSTIELEEDPFASDPPPLKKRRLSPPPIPSSTKTEAARAAGVAAYRRSLSNGDYSSKALEPRKSTAPAFKKATSSTAKLELDPIVFTSSPDPFANATRRRGEKRKASVEGDEDIFDLDLPSNGGSKPPVELNSKSNPRAGSKPVDYYLQSSDGEELPAIGTFSSKPFSRPLARSESILKNYNAEKAKEKAAREKSERIAVKSDKSDGRKASKEAEKERKQIAKEAKARERERTTEIAKVNTLRTDKKISSPEMIVDLPSSLDDKVAFQVKKHLDGIKVEYTEWQSALPIVKWRRKVVAEWNADIDIWVPVPQRIKTENHILCFLLAQDFVDLVTGEEGNNLFSHVLVLKSKFESCKIIYLIEGLTVWMRKNRNIKNKQFTEAVRSHLGQEASTATQRKKKREAEYVDEDMIEDALLNLQVMHDTLIHHTTVMNETSEWILNFTQHISTIPYRNQKSSLDTAFCMESGQVKTGDTPSDTYVKMLQEIIRITAPIAYGIAAEYPTVRKLVEGLEKNGPLALEDCKKSANKDGGFSDRRIGPAISKRLHKVFLGRDPGTWDV